MIINKRSVFIALLSGMGMATLPHASFAVTYNAGISQVGFGNPSVQIGSALKPYAVLRNLDAKGIFTVYVDVLKSGQSSPVHSFKCRTPELANQAEYRCAGNFSASVAGTYSVRARASSIHGSSFVFPGNSLYPGQKTSQPYTIGQVTTQPTPTPAPTPVSPTVYEEFTANGGKLYTRSQPTGSVTFGVHDSSAGDGYALALKFPGNPALGAYSNVSPAYATEAGFNQKTHFGRYEARVKFATCAPSEEVVNGIFVYDKDGTDQNRNGLLDINEIDIELLCGEPNFLWLTTWTDYSGDGVNQLRKKTRAINMHTGDYLETPAGREGTFDLAPLGNVPDVRFSGFPQPGTYYTVGFDWYPNRIRWYIVMDGKQVTLWDLNDASVIPQRPAAFLMNLWHSSTHWSSGGVAEYPDANSTMHVDYFKFTPFQ